MTERKHRYSIPPPVLYLSASDREANVRVLKWAKQTASSPNSHSTPIIFTGVKTELGQNDDPLNQCSNIWEA